MLLQSTRVTVSLFLFAIAIIGAGGNCFAAYFFKRQYDRNRAIPQHSTSLIFLIITIIDVCTCILALPVAITYATANSDIIFGSWEFCSIWAALNNLTTLTSVFLVGVLSVSRTVLLLKPECKISTRTFWLIAIPYLALILTSVSTLPLWYPNISYVYNATLGFCIMDSRNRDETLYFKLISIYLFFPIFPVIGSCILSTLKLRNSLKLTNRENRITTVKLKATRTIILVTLVYIVFNIPIFIYLSIWYHNPNILKEGLSVRGNALLRLSLDIISVGLNAAINPLIYLLTSEKYRNLLAFTMLSCVIKENFSSLDQ